MSLTHFFPFWAWLQDYRGETFKADLLAGATVALVLIPQSMAYAQLAGLPANYGLYAAFLPPLVAALFGSSHQLATGPVAVVSLMSAAALEPLATSGSAEFITYSITLSLVVGIFQFSLGILRLGMVVNFLSHPVINGFTNGAAIIIASSQFSKFFGVTVDKAPHHYQTIIRVAQAALDYTHFPTLLYGISAIAIMMLAKKISTKVPAVLLAVLITTVFSAATGFNNDTTVALSQIKSPEIKAQILSFNAATTQIQDLGSTRTRRGEEAEALDQSLAKKSHTPPSVALLILESQIAIKSTQIGHAKEEAHLIRKKLRYLKFEQTIVGGRSLFFPKENLPPETTSDGRTWRLKVSNILLNPQKLTLTSGGAIVGSIPRGLPHIAIPTLDAQGFIKLLPTAIIISLLGFMEAIAIARTMAAKTGQRIDANQELIGQGLANILGSMGSSYTVSGSFSRSAVNLQAGAVTGISSVVTSLVVVITLLYFTPLLYSLPQATLAAVILMAVTGLLNIKGFIHAWRAQKYDGIISVLSFLVTLYFAPHLDRGIMIGFLLSLGVFLYKSMRPVVSELSMHRDHVLKSSSHYRLKGCRHLSVVRFDGSLFFANASYLEEQIATFRSESPELRHILLDAHGINDMDASGEESLAMLVECLHAAKLGFAMSGVKEQVMAVMERTGLLETIGPPNLYPDTNSAVGAIITHIHNDPTLPQDCCDYCPLTQYSPEEMIEGGSNDLRP